MAKKKKNKLTQLDIYKSIRKDWGAISPVEKIVPDKKTSYNRSKEKNKIKNYFLKETHED
jgi:hypothetical protein